MARHGESEFASTSLCFQSLNTLSLLPWNAHILAEQKKDKACGHCSVTSFLLDQAIIILGALWETDWMTLDWLFLITPLFFFFFSFAFAIKVIFREEIIISRDKIMGHIFILHISRRWCVQNATKEGSYCLCRMGYQNIFVFCLLALYTSIHMISTLIIVWLALIARIDWSFISFNCKNN